MNRPTITDPETWLTERRGLLEEEKSAFRELDRIATLRRNLPMVRVAKDYRFIGPEGEVSLRHLFGERQQLIVQHFMFDPAWDDGCGSCTAMAESGASEPIRAHLARRGTAFAAVSRAPFDKLEAVRRARGWTFGWYSAAESDFDDDFHVSFDPDRVEPMYNFRDAAALVAAGEEWLTTYRGEQPGISCFLLDGDEVYHHYSTYGRGVEAMLPAYHLLDLTPLGRQEAWERPAGRATQLYRHDGGALSPERVTQ